MAGIAAVTFDFWDTLVIDDSDEPGRKAAGLPPKTEARRQVVLEAAQRLNPALAAGQVEDALTKALAWFTHQWKVEHRTPSVAQRLGRVWEDLQLKRGPSFDEVVNAWESMEVDYPPQLCPGAAEMLAELSGRYPLGIVSDAIVTPGGGIRQILQNAGLLHRFDALVFSDEAGASKPDRRVFDKVARRLGVGVEGLVHVGDRESNDVDGPLAVGARAILYVGAVDRRQGSTRAQAVAQHHAELPALLAAMS